MEFPKHSNRDKLYKGLWVEVSIWKPKVGRFALFEKFPRTTQVTLII